MFTSFVNVISDWESPPSGKRKGDPGERESLRREASHRPDEEEANCE